MNILFLASWYPTETNPNFGVFIKEHAHSIHTTENNIVVIAIVIHRSNDLLKVEFSDFNDEFGVRTVLIEIYSRFRDVIYHFLPLQYFYINKVFKKHIQTDFQPDIFHSNVIFPAGILGNWLSQKHKKPHIITEHWTRVRQFANIPILSLLGRKAYNNAVRILPVSEFLKTEICNSFSIFNNNKFTIVGNVIDSKLFYYKKKESNPNELRLCSIATWTYLKHPAKQPELIINAIAKIQDSYPKKIKLTMIGGGNKVPELIKLCETLKVDAEFTGYLHKNEIVKKLHESDFFVHPTNIETFGVVVAEAILTGTPVVCSDDSALREIVNDSNGVLCKNTVESWAEALIKLEEIKFDREKFSSEMKTKFNLENIGTLINTVYKSI
jgi:glycosyltransferase involved in cell wall biosynthesis